MRLFTFMLLDLWTLTASAQTGTFANASQPSPVRIWSQPADEPRSGDFQVAVDAESVPVALAHVAPADAGLRWKDMDDIPHSGDFFGLASFASFDLRAPVKTVRITYRDEVRQAKILPSSEGLVPAIHGREVTFSLDHPANLTIEVNDDIIGSLHLFANPWETNIPDANSPNVIYFGPGSHIITNSIKVRSGQTLYIAGGAILRGVLGAGPVIEMEGTNVALRGRGIIDGSRSPIHSRSLLYVEGDNMRVDGVILRDSSGWTLPIRRSHDVQLTGVKVFGDRANDDGFDICNSTEVTVDGCFLRTLDDLIVVKTDRHQGPVRHVVVRNCVLWNQVAHALSIGAELRENVDDVLFTNCDVIHDTGREWTLRIYHCDSAEISHVRFENIRVEQTHNFISLWINKAIWSRDTERGHIRDVTFRNIEATAAEPPRIELEGFDPGHAIDHVLFDNIQINGRPLRLSEVKTNAFVSDVSVKP